MINSNGEYLACLSWGTTLAAAAAGSTAGLDPALVQLGPAWAASIYGKLAAVVDQYLSTHPTSGSSGVIITSF